MSDLTNCTCRFGSEGLEDYDHNCPVHFPEVRTTNSGTATKDTNPKDAVGTRKAPMSVVPAPVIAEIGLGMLEGARKYGRHNYRVAGIRYSVYYDAAMRHLMAWWEGQDIDPDSGLSHVIKALCTLVVLRDAMLSGLHTDDRPPLVFDEWPTLNQIAGQIIDKYPEPKEPFTFEGELRKREQNPNSMREVFEQAMRFPEGKSIT